ASAADKMGVPEALVRRSAEARAKASGTSTDDILAAWAGGEAAPAAAAPPTSAPEAATPEPATPEPATETPPTPAPAAAPAAAPTIEPIPAATEVTPEEALAHPVVVTVPTMGITERTLAAIPRWVAVVFILIPAFGLLYLSGSGSAAVCDDGDVRLGVDVVTGDLVNCDGSAFEGRATGGGGGAQFLAIGEAQYSSCAGCHGANGEGGVGPAFGNINAVFTSCLDHVEWVRLGTNGFREAGIDTYGDLGKPVGGGGVMPGFPALTEEQLASVVAFERIRFGGANPDQTFIDCGLVEAPDTENGENGENGDAGNGENAAAEAARLTRSG
ncbi:MAG TPA: c-type cytochrome, partial [Acidimicrobiia bacterium]|nr:c-type cytochrome [Acidimicrobiia bacterium]